MSIPNGQREVMDFAGFECVLDVFAGYLVSECIDPLISRVFNEFWLQSHGLFEEFASLWDKSVKRREN